MFRFAFSLCLLSLLLCSVGCRMCCSPYDNCISTYIDRPDDFRGCGPMYRAGSILSGEYGMCQTDGGEIMYVGDSEGYYGNAGNYGVTTPVSIVQSTVQRPAETVELPQEPTRVPLIGIPQKAPTEQQPVQQPPVDSPIPGPYSEPNNTVPTVQELLNLPRRNTVPESVDPVPNQVPVTPPAKPKVETPSFEAVPTEDVPTETIPFSPNDTVPSDAAPQDIFPQIPTQPVPQDEPPITLEELRRLDPSVQDLQIISIEEG